MFSVDSDPSATFGNAMVFDDNSVATPYHGGAVYAGVLVSGLVVDFVYVSLKTSLLLDSARS